MKVFRQRFTEDQPNMDDEMLKMGTLRRLAVAAGGLRGLDLLVAVFVAINAIVSLRGVPAPAKHPRTI